MCPARGPGATANCAVANQVTTGKPVVLGMPTTRTKVLNPPAHPDVCCTNKNSVTLPIAPDVTGPRGGRSRRNNAAKYAQELVYRSKDWEAVYGLRNTVETFNAYTKSPTEEDLEQPARRRVRGYGFQVLLVTAMVAASNMRKIHAWLKRRNEPVATPTEPRPNEKPPTGLQVHRPPANAPPYAIPA